MIVVITIWLPRFAWSQAAIVVQAAPKAGAASEAPRSARVQRGQGIERARHENTVAARPVKMDLVV
ncbi:hypothetical protein M3484_08200 [Pseudomonas sp. GX19020]|uniref:hypothetical protein n=1 Tax=Pseudomonas sp. GX19020 TaxID=2942277 RepID=UPI002019C862|nr:hypothetical protein [Pseudomonas sp. GX19020]MCL4066551.1 hypothetical protein [Pseudomonas sp. GX19020]